MRCHSLIADQPSLKKACDWTEIILYTKDQINAICMVIYI